MHPGVHLPKYVIHDFLFCLAGSGPAFKMKRWALISSTEDALVTSTNTHTSWNIYSLSLDRFYFFKKVDTDYEKLCWSFAYRWAQTVQLCIAAALQPTFQAHIQYTCLNENHVHCLTVLLVASGSLWRRWTVTTLSASDCLIASCYLRVWCSLKLSFCSSHTNCTDTVKMSWRHCHCFRRCLRSRWDWAREKLVHLKHYKAFKKLKSDGVAGNWSRNSWGTWYCIKQTQLPLYTMRCYV